MRETFPLYRSTTGFSALSHPSALWTLPGRSAQRSRSPNWLNTEQRMIAGAGVMAVPDAVLLFAMGRADARIHVEHDAARRTTSMNAIDPSAGKIGKGEKVLF